MPLGSRTTIINRRYTYLLFSFIRYCHSSWLMYVLVETLLSTTDKLHCSLSVCAVRTYACREYEPEEDEFVWSQTNDKVVLRCVQNFNAARIWTLDCVHGRWIASDGWKVDCRSKVFAPPERPGNGSVTGAGKQGTGWTPGAILYRLWAICLLLFRPEMGRAQPAAISSRGRRCYATISLQGPRLIVSSYGDGTLVV